MISSVRGEQRNITAWWPRSTIAWRRRTAAPGLVNDCYAAFRHVASNADALGIDADRIVIGGASAGGGLAAGTALFARDQGGVQPSAQLLVYPCSTTAIRPRAAMALSTPERGTARRTCLRGSTTWEARHPPSTAHRRPALTSAICHRPISMSAPSTCSTTKDIAYATSLNRAAAWHANYTCTQVPSTARTGS